MGAENLEEEGETGPVVYSVAVTFTPFTITAWLLKSIAKCPLPKKRTTIVLIEISCGLDSRTTSGR